MIVMSSSAVSHNSAVHSLPCHIECDPLVPSRAAVEMYFKPAIVPSKVVPSSSSSSSSSSLPASSQPPSSSVLYASQFRGRQLMGRKISLPSSFACVTTLPPSPLDSVLRSRAQESGCKDAVTVDATFKDVTVWGHDFAPSDRDNAVVLSIEWAEMARAVHDPI